MRKTRNHQLPLAEATAEHPKAKVLSKISEILDRNKQIYDLVMQDLGRQVQDVGSNGLTAEQILRAAIVKQIGGYSYRELAFHLEDSRAYRWFCRTGFGKSFKKSAWQRGIKAISPETWEQVNRRLMGYATEQDLEKGRKVRIDSTVVESNIHAPYDSELLNDAVRVLARLLSAARTGLPGVVFSFRDHCRRAKRRNLGIMNAGTAEERQKLYKDLIAITENTVEYGEKGLRALSGFRGGTLEQCALQKNLIEQLGRFLPLSRQVLCQTRRRVLGGESVPAQEKIVSLFEPHTDIIRKDRRETFYGHKVCLTGGASNLILDCVIVAGNPADAELTGTMLARQEEIYGRFPLKAALDGGFSSHANLAEAKANGVKDVCFAKGRGLVEEDMCRSKWVYKALRNFRAGIESGISWLKRSLGLNRCPWKGLESFKSYVWASIVSANLLTLARLRLA